MITIFYFYFLIELPQEYKKTYIIFLLESGRNLIDKGAERKNRLKKKVTSC